MPAVTRIAFVSYDDDPPLGGQGIVLRGMRAALTARGHDVTTVAGRGANAITFPRVTGRAPLDLSLHLNRHPDVIRGRGADVVHAHGGPGGVLLLGDVGAPLVYTAHHTYAQAHARGSLRRLMAPLEARSYRRAARVLAVSASTARAVRALGVPPARVEVLTPGVDPPPPGGPAREPGRLLFAGRWEREKGVLDAVAVMRRVLELRAGVSAALVGTGHLEAAVRGAAAGSAIEVLGRVSEERLHAEYARAAVVLMPSLYEGLGLVAMEAHAAGAVVLGYDVDGLRDAVADPGLLVPPEDVTALTALTLTIIDTGTDAGAEPRAQAWIRQHSWDAVAVRLETVYRAILAGR
jgi:glycosyltransferase involved in cell wall biosynthesis